MCLGSMKFQVNDNNTFIVFHHGIFFTLIHWKHYQLRVLCKQLKLCTNIITQLCMAVLQTSDVPFFILLILVKIRKIRQGYFYVLSSDKWNLKYNCINTMFVYMFVCGFPIIYLSTWGMGLTTWLCIGLLLWGLLETKYHSQRHCYILCLELILITSGFECMSK